MAQTDSAPAGETAVAATNPYLAHLKQLLDAAAHRVAEGGAAESSTSLEPLRTLQIRILSKIDSTEGLPALPEVLVKLDEAIRSPHSSARDIADALKLDPSIAAKVLGLVNSVAFGLPREVKHLDQAVAYLGLREVRSLAMAAFVVSVFPLDKNGSGFDQRAFWRHSLAVGIGCRSIARTLEARRPGEIDTEDAFMAGLLHDLGKIYLAQHFPESYAEARDVALRLGVPFEDAELSTLGLRHTDIGHRLIAAWSVPDEIVAAVEYHHEPRAAGPLARIVHLTDHMSRGLGIGAEPAGAPRLDPTVFAELDLTDQEIGDIAAAMMAGVDEVSAALGL